MFLIKEKLLEENFDADDIPVTTYVINMRNKIREFMKCSNVNESDSKAKQKVYYDRNSRKRNYNFGEKYYYCFLPLRINC